MATIEATYPRSILRSPQPEATASGKPPTRSARQVSEAVEARAAEGQAIQVRRATPSPRLPEPRGMAGTVGLNVAREPAMESEAPMVRGATSANPRTDLER